MTVAAGDQPKRGELRIYLGAAPGVGKTFAMLGEAHRRLERGTDVVAAVVETHGRKKTAELLDGIEAVPPRYIDYRGSRFPELDVDAVLARHPQVVLVDELAHTNTPGSKNPKRWQDVEELLDAGITVISTVNVQHLESLNDVVTQITGIEQQEKVPDEVVRAADQIELVDITPEALRRRLSHGNVYAPERIDAALSNYFRRGNLTALRELALLWLADQVDAALAKYRADNKITDTWEARERVVVAVTGGPESETLVRRASRIASKSSAELMVVHVVRGDGLSGVSAPQMGKVRELAASLGATVHTVVGDDVPAALLDFAREMNATQLVIGTSRRSRWARIFDEGIGAAVVQQSGKIDVHMVTHEEAKRGLLAGRSLSPRQRHADVLAGRRSWCRPPSARSSSGCSTRSSASAARARCSSSACWSSRCSAALPRPRCRRVLSGLLLNYFLVEPRHTFTIAEPDSAITDRRAARSSRSRSPRWSTAPPNGPGRPTQASQEAELLALFAGSVLRGADLDTLLERVRETYSQRAVSMLRVSDDDGGSRRVRRARIRASTVDSADTAIEVGDDEFWMLMAGSKLRRPRPPRADRRRQTGGGPGQAARAHRGGRQGRGDRAGRRAAPLAAVRRQPRPAHAAGGRQGRGVQPAQRRRRLLRRGHRRTARHRRGVDRPADRAGRQPARLVAAGRRRGRARTCSGSTSRRRCSARCSESARASTGFRSVALDRVKVDVDDAVAMADAACWSGCWPT